VLQELQIDGISAHAEKRWPREESTLKLAGHDCALHDPPLHPSKAFVIAASRRGAEIKMRAEVERLVEEIKQSVGLLRRHL